MTIHFKEPDRAAHITDPLSRERALLQTWFSPSFPIGSFAYSQGLESSVHAGLVKNADELQTWICDLFQFGSISNDLIISACAWKATAACDWAQLNAVTEFAAAFQPSAERYFESITQGRCFLEAISAAWPSPNLATALDHLGNEPSIAYAPAAGLASAAHGLRLIPTLEAFALAFVANQISAGIRLGVLGHSAGQKIIAALLPLIADAAATASIATLDEIGTASFSADLASLEHETLYTRLFRT
ncbi:MAG: urease accessory UreF family protein [Rhodomicrobium sp.]